MTPEGEAAKRRVLAVYPGASALWIGYGDAAWGVVARLGDELTIGEGMTQDAAWINADLALNHAEGRA